MYPSEPATPVAPVRPALPTRAPAKDRDLVRQVAKRALRNLAPGDVPAPLTALLRSLVEGRAVSTITLPAPRAGAPSTLASSDATPPIVIVVATAPRDAEREAGRALGLTEREAEVAALAAQGFSAVNIAAALEIGESTVRTHLKRTYAKLGVFSRVELTRRLTAPSDDLVCVIRPTPAGDAPRAARPLQRVG